MKKENDILKKYKDKNLIFVTLIILLTLIIMSVSYIIIYKIIEKQSINRLNEYCDSVIDEAFQKYNRDSEILNAAAQMISLQEDLSKEGFGDILIKFQPLISTMKIRVIFPDNTIVTSEGNSIISDASYLDFKNILNIGEHTSNRIKSITTGEYIIRHYVPVIKDGETKAIIYGAIDLNELKTKLNIFNYYETHSNIYVFEKENGEEILNTKNSKLDNFYENVFNEENIQNIKNKIALSDAGYLLVKEYNESSYLYFKNMNMNNWYVIVEVPYDYAMKDLTKIRNLCLIFAITELFCLMIFYVHSLINAKETLDKNILEEKALMARQSEKAKTVFFNNLSHDIRTPLNAINGFTNIALNENCDNKKIEDCLNKISISNKYLLALVNEVLDANNISDQTLTLNMQNNNISEMLGEITTVFEAYINTKKISFIYDFDSIIHKDILCDRLKFYKIIVNILSNAAKYTDINGKIEFKVFEISSDDSNVNYEFSIKDNGKGMSEETLNNIYKAFYVEDKFNEDSHGLGMCIVKKLIDLMDGRLEIKSSKNSGTEYKIDVSFPKYTNVNENAKQKNNLNTSIKNNKSILIVEDNILNSQILLDMIERCGYKGISVQNHYECLDVLDNNIIDMIITDIKLPEIDGFKLIETIKNNHRSYSDIPIIILSANSSQENYDKAEKLGIEYFMLKPVIFEDLKEILAQILK